MFLVYNPVVGGFIPGGPDASLVAVALDAARAKIGEAEWKRGNTLNREGGATALVLSLLADIGVKPSRPSGVLKSVGYAETSDARGNVYRKVRVCLANPGHDDTMISVDIDTEVGERLIQKLGNPAVTRGAQLAISAFAVAADDGRPYVNHVVSVKLDGAEVTNLKGIYEAVKLKAEAVKTALKAAGVTDDKALKAAVTTARKAESLAQHEALAKQIEQRIKQTPVTAPAETAATDGNATKAATEIEPL